MILPRETALESAPPEPPRIPTQTDVVVVGVGAAGLFAATWAGRAQATAGTTPSVVGIDGARKIGAKILVSGGGRCNVTHWRVDERDFAGSTSPAIRKVLGRFTVEQTIAFFASSGVVFYREADTGKLFPESDSARSILDSLLREARAAGVALHHPAEAPIVRGVRRDVLGHRRPLH